MSVPECEHCSGPGQKLWNGDTLNAIAEVVRGTGRDLSTFAEAIAKDEPIPFDSPEQRYPHCDPRRHDDGLRTISECAHGCVTECARERAERAE